MDRTRIDGHSRRLLRIYLNDHLMGAAGAIELTRRAARNNGGTPLGAFLEQLLPEIADDRRALEELMARLRFPVDPLKLVAAAAAEKAGRLKLNGQILGYSDLSRVLELEALWAGVALKRNLWRCLQQLEDQDVALAGMDLGRLIERASAQLDGLEHHRLEAVSRAFAAPGAMPPT